MVARIPTPGIPTPKVRASATAQPAAKTQLKVVLPSGNRVGIKDIGKSAGTPKPKPALPMKSNSKYFADQKAFIASRDAKK